VQIRVFNTETLLLVEIGCFDNRRSVVGAPALARVLAEAPVQAAAQGPAETMAREAVHTGEKQQDRFRY
jgi:hypothetical protein